MNTNSVCIDFEWGASTPPFSDKNGARRGARGRDEDDTTVISPKFFRAPVIGYAKRSEHIARLRSFFSLGHCWDGEAASAPSSATIHAVMSFVNILPYEKLGFRIGLERDGSISLFYETNGYFIDIGFDSLGISSFYGRNPTGKEIYGDGPFDPSNPPKDLIEFAPET